MLKLVREEEGVYAVISDKENQSGKGTMRQATRRLYLLGVQVSEIQIALEEIVLDVKRYPQHNVAHFGIGMTEGGPKFIFSEYVDLNPPQKGVA